MEGQGPIRANPGEGVTTPYFQDFDGDGFGDATEVEESCEAPDGACQADVSIWSRGE